MSEDQAEYTQESVKKVGWNIKPPQLSEQGEKTKAGLQQEATTAPPAPHLTDQGEEVKTDLVQGRDDPWAGRPGYRTPQAQATLNALKGNRG